MSKALPPSPALSLVCLAILGLLSCEAPKNTGYFQTVRRDTTLMTTVAKNFDQKIVPGDLLSISIASASPELSGLFNTAVGTAGTAPGYLVNREGNIQLYKLGSRRVAGSTLDGVKAALEKDLEPYLKDPLVTVRFLNHRITVLGEVGSPGVIQLSTEQITLLEAIGEKGDLTEKAKRDNILVIRQTGSGKEFKHLSLLDHSIFSSPYFYLQNEDVVYVEPETPKRSPQNTQQIVSYVLSGISILTLIISRIK